MESKTNYTLVGIIVLVLIAALFSAALWLSVGFNQKEYSFYTVYLHESAAGLSEQAAVKYNGVQVGFVKSIKLSNFDPRQVEITLSIEEGTPITTSTSATLISQGITGVTYVGLAAGAADLTPLRKMPGEPYPVIPAKPSLFNQLDMIIKDVSENIKKVSTEAERIFNEKNALYIKNTLANMEKTSKTIADNNANIDRSLKEAHVFLANMARASKKFPMVVKDFHEVAVTLKHAGTDASKTMVAGKNAMNKFKYQAIPPAVILLQRLNEIAANLESVSNDMRQNPSVVIRGTKPPKSGPGE